MKEGYASKEWWDQVGKLDRDGLIELNKLVIKRLKAIRDEKDGKAAQQWRPGQQVAFSDKHGKPLSGTVKYVNQRTLSIVTDEGVGWRVAYCHCYKPEDGATEEERNDLEKALQKIGGQG